MKSGVIAMAIMALFICSTFFLGAPESQIDHEKIIDDGVANFKEWRDVRGMEDSVQNLLKWYNEQKEVEYARYSGGDITVKFNDEHYIVILGMGTPDDAQETVIVNKPGDEESSPTQKTAILLGPFEWQFGKGPIPDIKNDLESIGYTCEVYFNEDVSLPLIENELSKGLVFNFGHGGGGVWNDDGVEKTIICTGEHWTDETPTKYPEEYRNKWIIQSLMSYNDGNYYVCYTPEGIDNFYGELPNSLIYMESCNSIYTTTLGDAFVKNGAGAYMGWSRVLTVYHGNRWAEKDFEYFLEGYNVSAVCEKTPTDIYGAKLEYVGAGDLTLK